MEEKLSALIAGYRDYIVLLIGVLLVVGAVKDWGWLCSPVGKPDGHLLSRGMYRLIFGALGLILIFCELMVLF